MSKDKIHIKYDKKGKLRPFHNVPYVEDMSSGDIEKESLYRVRNIEKISSDNLKVQKRILIWIQVFGFITIVGVVFYFILYFF